jgi:LEA14-like dessication related protein
MITIRPVALTALLALALVGCSGLREPLKVSLAGVDRLEGAGMEARFMARMRVQNPNDAPIVYDGVAVDVELNGNSFASGVSDAKGEVARFGESLVEVSVTVPASGIVRQVLGLFMAVPEKLTYRVRGFLNTGTFGRVPFDSTGELDMPKAPPDS